MYNSIDEALKAGKKDSYSKLQGGFSIYLLSNNKFDYFPYGQPANINGQFDKAALKAVRVTYKRNRWTMDNNENEGF